MASDAPPGIAATPHLPRYRGAAARFPAFAAVVIFSAYLGFFKALISTAATHPYAAHVVFVPVLAAVLLWIQRRALYRPPPRHSLAGAAVVGVALGVLPVAYVTANVPLQTISFVAALGGFALWQFGRQGLRDVRFVLVFLLLMLPPPRNVVSVISPPIQELVAAFSEVVLRVLTIPVERQGIFLHLPGLTLEVAEECSGLRFLPILVVFVAAFARAVVPTTRLQLALIALSIPVAILANWLRVAVTSVGAYVIGPQVATGAIHYYIGKGFWVLALLAMIGIACLLRARAHRQSADSRPQYVTARP